MDEPSKRSLEFGGITIGITPEVDAQPLDPESPFRILLMGDFSGSSQHREPRTGAELATRKPKMVDRDNFEQVLEQGDVTLRSALVGQDGQPVSIHFRELDDFEPDQLYETVSLFSSLAETRRKLLNSSTFEEAAAEVRAWRGASDAQADADQEVPSSNSPDEPPGAGQSASDVDLGDLLNRAVGATQQPEGLNLTAGSINIEKLVQEIVAPYVVDKPDPQQAELVECVDQMISGLMRSLLHHPGFRSLEAAWRNIFFLISRLETDATLHVYVLDVAKSDIAADLASAESLASSGIYKLLVEQTVGTPGAQSWSMIVGDYVFDATREDALLAGSLATVAASAGAPFVASANSRLFGCPSVSETPDPDDWRWKAPEEVEEAWQAVRELGVASNIGLIAPRVLVRTPYGKQSSPIDTFDFEENPEAQHESYLWGNPAYALAYLLGDAFTRNGWDFHPGMIDDLDDLPLHVFKVDGESQIKPCAESLIGDRAIRAITEAGVIPLASFKGLNKARFVQLCSLAADGSSLAGRWQG